VYGPGDFDLVGFIVGVVERDAIIDGVSIRPGDALLGLPSSGLHTNGYSLARNVLRVGTGGNVEEERARLERHHPELGTSWAKPAGRAPLLLQRRQASPGQAEGHRAYHGRRVAGQPAAHPARGYSRRLHKGAWPAPPIFRLIQERGNVAADEMYRAFNMGLGMVLVCDPSDVEAVRAQVDEAIVVGEVVGRGRAGRLEITFANFRVYYVRERCGPRGGLRAPARG
jgi:phosphoribosylformylglycinamidine cyclo-ligase